MWSSASLTNFVRVPELHTAVNNQKWARRILGIDDYQHPMKLRICNLITTGSSELATRIILLSVYECIS